MTEMNGSCNPCALQLKNKAISFRTMDGLLWVDPQNDNVLLPECDIFIDEVQIDNLNIEQDLLTENNSTKKFAVNTRSIKINVAYAAWCNKENIYLDFRLNKNEQWKPLNNNNGTIIQLYNLPPGTYNLEIRKHNGFGNYNYTYKKLRFAISAPWFNQWWFFLFAAGCTIGNYSAVHIYQDNKIQNKTGSPGKSG